MELKKIEVENETIYLKKGLFGWNVVEPWKDENGKINWFNLIAGGWRTLIPTLFILFLLLLFYLAWREMADQAAECFSRNLTVIKQFVDYKMQINLSDFLPTS